MNEVKIRTKGMHCVGCEGLIEDVLLELPGVQRVKSDFVSETTTVSFDPTKTDVTAIMKAIDKAGYRTEGVLEEKKSGGLSKKRWGFM